MTDLELTRLCAEAMGIRLVTSESNELATIAGLPYWHEAMITRPYWPLHDDAQAMALVKHCKLEIRTQYDHDRSLHHPKHIGWYVTSPNDRNADSPDLNRAICEAVAKMQGA